MAASEPDFVQFMQERAAVAQAYVSVDPTPLTAISKLQGKGQPVKMSLRVTEVFRREEGAWKLARRHADSLAEAAKATGHAQSTHGDDSKGASLASAFNRGGSEHVSV